MSSPPTLSATLVAEASGSSAGFCIFGWPNVPKCRWDEVLPDDLPDGDIRPREEAKWDHVHVRWDVLEADGHEARDGEPDAHHLASHVLRLPRQEDSHAHHPIATNAFHESLEPIFRHLLLC